MLLSYSAPPHRHTIQELEQVHTPLLPDVWEVALRAHLDKAYVAYIVQELREGFRVGFRWDSPLKSATHNMHSTIIRLAMISEYSNYRLTRDCMLGSFPLAWRQVLHVKRFGLIPKGHSTGKFRLITDLSYPHGASVNDGIDPALTLRSYTSVDSVAQRVQWLGKGSLLAKMDIKSAYRLIPVHLQDRIL